MHEELIIAGAGGQGVVFIGELLILAVMAEKNVTGLRSYGPTMRGGKANYTVIISDEEIGSPISEHPNSLIIMNKPSLEFSQTVKPGGLIVINKSLVAWDAAREDVEILEIRAGDIAKDLGDLRAANLVALGAYLKKKQIVSLENIKKALEDVAAEKKWNENLLELNKKALLNLVGLKY